MRIALALIAVSLVIPADGPLLAAARKSASHKQPAASSSARKGAPHKSTARKSTARKGSAHKGTTARQSAPGKTTTTARSRKGRTARTARSRQSWRSRQLQPTQERYQEIQQALVAKGYLKGAADGAWNQDSTDALRRFQKDQNLEPSGKIDSLSLIALGLGPKHENTASATPPPAGPATRPPTP